MSTAMAMWANRNEMIRDFGKGRICAEIGVLAGEFSRRILATEPKKLVLVDIWRRQTGEYKSDGANRRDLEALYKSIRERYGKMPNVQIVRDWSVAAAAKFHDAYFDWVYIDANHTWRGIAADVHGWWPKVKAGGYLAGHDYGYPRHPAVKAIVDAWASLHGRPVLRDAESSWAIPR